MKKTIAVPHCASCIKTPATIRANFCEEIEELYPSLFTSYLKSYPERFSAGFSLNKNWGAIVKNHITVQDTHFTCLLCNTSDVYTCNSIILHFSACTGDIETCNDIIQEYKDSDCTTPQLIKSYYESIANNAWMGIAMKFGIFIDQNFKCKMCADQVLICNEKVTIFNHFSLCKGMVSYLRCLTEMMLLHKESIELFTHYTRNKLTSIRLHPNLIGAKAIPRGYRKIVDQGQVNDSALLILDQPIYKAVDEAWVHECINYGVFYLELCRFQCLSCQKYIYHDKKVIFRHLTICLLGDQRSVFMKSIRKHCPDAIVKFNL